jgi:hypothetical protein
MALVLNDRVKETTTTTGTGTVNLAGAEVGFETFVAGIGNTNTTYYSIVHQTADEFEVGLGTVSDSSPDTLSRTTIISSSNSDSAVNFSAGTKDVFCTLPASKAVFIDGSGDLEFNAPGDDFSFTNSSNTIAVIKTTNNDFIIQNNLNDKDFILKGYDSDGGGLKTGLTIDYSDGATAIFGGKIQANDAIKFNSNTGTPEFQFLGSGTETGVINLGSSNFTIESKVSDKDIIFKGVDGGSDITALTVDMSDAGRANFNGGIDIAAGTDIELNDGNWTGEKARKIQAHSGHIYYQSASHVFRNASGTNTAQVDGSGNFVALANITAYGSPSDIKLKQNIEVIDNALDKVKQLKGITYTLKSDGNRLTGLIAQDLEKVLPEAVYTSETIPDEINGIEAEEHLAIRYGNTVGLLVEAIKEQQEQIETLTAKVKELEVKG